LPWTSDVYALFWNKDLFRAAGLDPERPPQTMEELAGYAARLTARDAKGNLVQIGFLPDPSRPHNELYARMWGNLEEDGAAGGDDADRDDVAAWQRQFTVPYDDAEVKQFVLSFNRYANSNHPTLDGQRLDCRQCHRLAPPKGNKLPARALYEGKVAMWVGGEWLAGAAPSNVGVAPVPPPADHPERAGTNVVEGAVIVMPAGAQDKRAAAHLLAWMLSPEIAAEVASAGASLPAGLSAAQNPRFQGNRDLEVFLALLAHPNAKPTLNPGTVH
jgi:ABC-type glycerol-3-phosphate transport system substrate-binding protein